MLKIPLMFAAFVLLAVAQEKTPAAKSPRAFVLNTEEALKLDNLKLRIQLLNAQIQLSSLQIQAVQAQLNSDKAAFVAQALKDHHNPANVVFNDEKFSFQATDSDTKK
jgi:hypothetical protein